MHFLQLPVIKYFVGLTVILVVCYILWKNADSITLHRINPLYKIRQQQPTALVKTFESMLHSITRWIIVAAGLIATLKLFGFDLDFFIYLISGLALAISLGAQSLIKDIINGIFALIDNSFTIGEVISIGEYTGKVESLSVRTLTMRHSSGNLQTIPFSEVGSIKNHSRDYKVFKASIIASFETSIDDVYDALTRTANEMASDSYFGEMILEPLSSFGIDKFRHQNVHASASIKIKPDPANSFGREFNRRLKYHMEQLNISPAENFDDEQSEKLVRDQHNQVLSGKKENSK